MDQTELNLGPRAKTPRRGQIDEQEYALIRNKEGGKAGFVHGTYEEVEYYCENNDLWVDRYLDHVDPMTVQRRFKYVGSGHDPCAVARPIYQYDDKGNFIGYTEFKEKW